MGLHIGGGGVGNTLLGAGKGRRGGGKRNPSVPLPLL